MIRTVWVAVASVALAVSPAFAEDNQKGPAQPTVRGDKHVVVVEPSLDAFATPHAAISPYIYLNRCTGGCMVQKSGINDARSNQSTIPKSGSGCPAFPNCTLTEFETAGGQTGSSGKCVGGDANGAVCTDETSSTDCPGGGDCRSANDEWEDVVQCMKEVYSPFNVTVSDTKPAQGQSYTMAIIAGEASQINWVGALGVAPLAPDCSAQDNVISFSFANDHGAADRINNICWTAAQETAHALGLDHEYQFADGSSACNDPMTYRFDCGGQKFFRNKPASCGEMAVRPCQCGGSQNSHLKIFNVFGEGTSLIPPPTVGVTAPLDGATIQNGAVVSITAGSRRGIEKVELWLNGYKWGEAPGAKFRDEGQPNPSNYSIMMPTNVPDGVIDVVVKAFDDIGEETDAPTITVTKGAPCSSADTCATGQKCEAGKCFWDAPVGVLGDECSYAQYCESGLCVDTSEGSLCSQDCVVGSMDGCPADFECVAFGQSGACVPTGGGGGCCSIGKRQSSTQVVFQLVFGALILGFVVRRRRRRHA
jgi:hypothetical protein